MRLTTSYHDSVPSPGHLLPEYEERAKSQETLVLRWFQAHPDQAFSREEIEAIYSWPTQTCSRILANLTARHALEKTTETVVSSFGRRARTWRLARPSINPVVQERLAL